MNTCIICQLSLFTAFNHCLRLDLGWTTKPGWSVAISFFLAATGKVAPSLSIPSHHLCCPPLAGHCTASSGKFRLQERLKWLNLTSAGCPLVQIIQKWAHGFGSMYMRPWSQCVSTAAQQYVEWRVEMDTEVTLALYAHKQRPNTKGESMGRLWSLLCLSNARCTLSQLIVLTPDLHPSPKGQDVAQGSYSG